MSHFHGWLTQGKAKGWLCCKETSKGAAGHFGTPDHHIMAQVGATLNLDTTF